RIITSFIFQAEDGIRTRNVTGVQTCALPISTEDILQLLKNKSDNKLYKLTKNIQWPKTKLRIERGEMPETLLEIMQKEQCDLLVCGHHHSFINRLMPAYRGMINKLSADLLIVPFIDK